MGNIKEINIKNRAYYFFQDFDSKLLKIDKKSHTKILIIITLDMLQ